MLAANTSLETHATRCGISHLVLALVHDHRIRAVRLQGPAICLASSFEGYVRAHVRLEVSRAFIAAFTDPESGYDAQYVYSPDNGRLQTRIMHAALLLWIQHAALDLDLSDHHWMLLYHSLLGAYPTPIRLGRPAGGYSIVLKGGWIDPFDLTEHRQH